MATQVHWKPLDTWKQTPTLWPEPTFDFTLRIKAKRHDFQMTHFFKQWIKYIYIKLKNLKLRICFKMTHWFYIKFRWPLLWGAISRTGLHVTQSSVVDPALNTSYHCFFIVCPQAVQAHHRCWVIASMKKGTNFLNSQHKIDRVL